jgi:endonuclease/exonuclease/phosphatase family metal-dependent hydrolase
LIPTLAHEVSMFRSKLLRVALLAIPLLCACSGGEESALVSQSADVAVAPRGTATTLDVANWNVEWFGSTVNGPTDEALQQANVRDTIAGTDFDIWALQEVVSVTAFSNLVAGLPGYAGILSNDARVTNGSAFYSSTEQKVAVLWKTSLASLVSAKLILTANDFDFAGRPPMEVALSVTLNGATEQRVFIVFHAKAFADSASWQRRQNASVALKGYLDSTYPSQKVFVVGDWNDDLDTSILAGSPSPYQNFTADTARYSFPTLALTQAGISTTCAHPDPVDHQMNTNEQFADLVVGSVQSYHLDSQISGYCTNTTDHFPTLVRYDFPNAGPPPPPPSASVTVTAPNGGESWAAGSTHDITWSSSGVANLKLDYSLDAGATWTPITTSVAASAGRFAWTLPAQTSTAARVRASEASTGTPSDESDASFTIAAAATPAKVILNEILANEPGSSTAGEFIEIANVGGTSIDISAWKLWDGTAARHTFAAGTVLGAGKAIAVFAAASGIPPGTPNAIASSTGVLSLANAGDSVSVRNAAGTIVDSFTYPASLAGTDGVSMNRNPDATAGAAFVLHTAISTLKASPGTRANGAPF